MPGESPFAEAFGQLIAQCRSQPDDYDAVRALLARVSVVVARAPIVEEAGLQLSGMLHDQSLRGRMHTRGVEAIQIAAGAPAEELLTLAEALAADAGALPSTDAVALDLVQVVAPGPHEALTPPVSPALPEVPGAPAPRQRPPGGLESETSEGGGAEARRGPRLDASVERDIEALQAAVGEAVERGAWMEAIHGAQALIRLGPRVPAERRGGFNIQIRRLLGKPVLESFIEFAIRSPEEQSRVGDVLRSGGREAVEAMVASIAQTETSGARQFLHDALIQTPNAFPQILPLLESRKPTVVCHAAELLGRLHNPRAIPALLGKLDHPEERIRGAVLHALAAFEDPRVFEALRQGLRHDSPDTRAEAARAIATSGRSPLGMPLLVALEQERDSETWGAMARALGRIETPDATAALVTVAMEKKGLLRKGYTLSQRLEAVGALADAGTAAARSALRRLAEDADGEVAAAAREASAALGQA